MATVIRMARAGAKKRPYYRIVVADSRMPRDGRYIEKIGTHNPMLAKDDENRIIIDLERLKHWMDQGAKPSDRILRFLEAMGVVKGKKTRSNPNKGKPGQKALDRIEERADKVTAAAEAAEAAKVAAAEAAEAAKVAAAEAAAAPAPAEEAPAEEAPAEEAAAEAPAEEAAAEAPAEEAATEEAPAEAAAEK